MTPTQFIGLALSRAVVPLWVMTGAIFKMTEKTPTLLPSSIVDFGADVIQINLYWLLAILIVIEMILAGIMFFLPRLARPTAIFTLAVFCIVLIIEMLRGADSCGCLGGASPPPWLMLTIDGALLLGVLVFAPPKLQNRQLLPSGPATVTALWALGVISITAAMILPETRPNDTIIAPQPQHRTADNGQPEPGNDQTAAPTQDSDTTADASQATSIPSLVRPKPGQWVGKRWNDITFSKYVSGWPADLNTGRQYVIFYSRSCDHCQNLLNYFFYDPPVNTTIVATPETKAGFDVESELPMQCAGCVELELPIGTEWFFTPPLVVALEDGVVKCAAEAVDADVEKPECLLWHE